MRHRARDYREVPVPIGDYWPDSRNRRDNECYVEDKIGVLGIVKKLSGLHSTHWRLRAYPCSKIKVIFGALIYQNKL